MNEEEKIEREQTKDETDKKCPSCGGLLNFSPETGGLVCPYCGYTEQIQHGDATCELDLESAESVENCDWGEKKKSVICESCGAELIFDELEIASKCPYCDSNLVTEEGAPDTMAPGGVCPFKITKKDAGNRFVKWIKGKLFCPSKAKKAAKAREFTGVYLPYWTFDADTYSSYSARYSKTRTRRVNGKTQTYTTWHSTFGHYNRSFDDVQIAGSERYDASMLKKIEPFDTENNVAYKPEYVAGFGAERYSVGIRDAWERAKAFIKSILRSEITGKIRSEHAASGVSSLSVDTSYENTTYKYLLVPVWISSYKYNGKIYSFMVNGRTGKVGGKYPISPWRVLAAILLGLAVIALLYFWFMYME